MRQRVHDLAARFTEGNDAVITLIESCADTEWRMPCLDEGWPVGVTVHHIAMGYDQEGWVAALVAAILARHPLPPHPADLHPEREDYNAWHARQFAACTKDETLALLRRYAASALQLIQSVHDEDLEITAPADASDSDPVSIGWIIEHILINHAYTHLTSLRATLRREQGMGCV